MHTVATAPEPIGAEEKSGAAHAKAAHETNGK
jgi:hypothetical protein